MKNSESRNELFIQPFYCSDILYQLHFLNIISKELLMQTIYAQISQ